MGEVQLVVHSFQLSCHVAISCPHFHALQLQRRKDENLFPVGHLPRPFLRLLHLHSLLERSWIAEVAGQEVLLHFMKSPPQFSVPACSLRCVTSLQVVFSAS